MSSYITFKVIKIIDDYSLVINGGLNNDISKGDEVEIFLEGDEIIDPFMDGKVLGTLDYIKDILEVTEVYTNFAVCEKIVTEKIYTPSPLQKAFFSSGIPSALNGTTQTKRTLVKINVVEEEKTGRKKGDKIIRIGDLARIALSE
jgi:hypothetical protein